MGSDLQIPLFRIPDEGLELDLEVEAEALELEEGLWPPVSGVRLVGRLERTSSQEAVFRGSVRGNFLLECSLGLAQYEHRFEERFSVYCLPPPPGGTADSNEEVELEEKDLEVAYISNETLDLLPPLRDQIDLAIPLQPKCPERCLGEDPERCRRLEAGEPLGEKEAVDPRWAGLKDWDK